LKVYGKADNYSYYMRANAASRDENRSLEKAATGRVLMKRVPLMVLASFLIATLQLLA
jgi:hypothetical protein